MPTLFILLFKINLVLVVFAAAYYLVLRKLTFYGLNRVFLLFGILFSSAYPFINLSNLTGRYDKIASIVPQISQGISEYIKQDNFSTYWQTVNIIFWAGVLVMASRLAVQFFSLYRIHKNSKPGQSSDYKIRILADNLGPFSFWQTIYINPKLHNQNDLANILKHEKVHVEEWHTLDIILAELSLVFYWFNPGVWLMKRAVRENIEFITDAKILKKGIDKKTYQYSLLHAGNLVPAMAIVNNFSLSDLKKRIKMMNVRRSSPIALSRYLFLLPVLLLTTLAFTITKKDEIAKIIFSQPLALTREVSTAQPQAAMRINRKKAKIKKEGSLAAPQKDSLKRVLIIEAFDTDSGFMPGGLDELPQPLPGERIKMITIKRNPARGGDGGTFSSEDTLGRNLKNVFIVHREGDQKPPPGLLNIRHAIIQGQNSDIASNPAAKFFLNGKEISQEEFKKIDLIGRDGAPAKKLMIGIDKGKN
ncbi:M56 family metallopeptidase [Daejeonella sp.]|uniref:M56 family metallopeptidase n=1 Tax=Daejeonella sp. TaxID=2805397 RepID=UPI0030BE72AF